MKLSFSMDTKFSKISSNAIPKWSNFFTAADSWLETLQLLSNNKNQIYWGTFYVIPWIVSFCLELYIKAIAAHEDNQFNGNRYNHKTSKILSDYKSIPIFREIYAKEKFIQLIKEYENTKDTKFGETYVVIDGGDQKKLINLIYTLREEMCKRTGLN